MPERSVTIRISAQDSFSDVMRRYNAAMGQAESSTTRAGNAAHAQQNTWQQLTQRIQGAVLAFGVMGVARVAEEMVDLGHQVQIASQNFDALARSVLGVNSADVLQQLRDVTGGIVTDLDLMTSSNRLLSMGLASSTGELTQLTNIAVRLGQAFGRDASESVENFGLLLANKSILRLDSFGISADRVRTRIAELKGTMTDDEAFRMAVLEEGERSLDRLGNAAAAAETPLTRLQATISNIGAEFSDRFTQGVEGLIGLLEILSTYGVEAVIDPGAIAEQRRMQEESLRAAAASYVNVPGATIGVDVTLEEAMAQSKSIRQFALENRDLLDEAIRAAQEFSALGGGQPSLDSSTSLRDATGRWREEQARERARQGSIDFLSNFNYYQVEAESMELMAEYARQVNVEEARRVSFNQETSTLMIDIAGEYQALTDAAGELDGVDIINPEDAERVGAMADRFDFLLERARALNEQGIISDAELEGFENAADRARDMADELRRGADALEDMSTNELFGTDDGGLFAQLGDEVIAAARDRGLTDEQIQALADAFDQESGRENEASMRWRDEVIPLIVATAETNSADAAKEALLQYLGEMANARFGEGAANFLTGGSYFDVGAAGLGNEVWTNATTGEAQNPVTTFSEIAGHTMDISTDFEDIATHAVVFGDKITAARDDLIEMVQGAKTITLDFRIGDMPPLLAELLALISGGGLGAAMAGATRDNGGTSPGAISRTANTTGSVGGRRTGTQINGR